MQITSSLKTEFKWPCVIQLGKYIALITTSLSVQLCLAGSIEVHYKNADTDSGTYSSHIKPIIEIVNSSNQTISLAPYSIRYWFTNETKPETPVLDIFYAQNTGNWASPCSYPYSCISHQFSQIENQEFLQLNFSQTNQQLQPGKKLHIQLGIHSSSWGSFNTSNDFSAGNITSLQPWENISLYQNNELVFGSEPEGINNEEEPPLCLEYSPQVLSASTQPLVVNPNQTEPVKFSVQIPGPSSETILCLAPNLNAPCTETITLTGPDNECRYTSDLSVDQITQFYNPEQDINRAVFGFLNTATVSGRRNLIANIASESESQCTIENINSKTQACSHIVNLVIPEIYSDFQNLTIAKRQIITRRFFEIFDDDYDFINIISGSGNYFQNRSYYGVTNNIEGIGLNLVDRSAQFGSGGRLKGTVVYPISTSFDGASKGHSHELGHAWANFSKHPLLSGNTPHWPISSLANGIMGYSTNNGQGLNFDKELRLIDGAVHAYQDAGPKSFTSLALYAMGLIPPEEVKYQIIMLDKNDPNQFPSSEYTTLSINDYIAYNGERSPSFETSQKTFNVATVIVSKELLDQHAMTLFNNFAKRAESINETEWVKLGLAGRQEHKPFYSATGGRANLKSAIY